MRQFWQNNFVPALGATSGIPMPAPEDRAHRHEVKPTRLRMNSPGRPSRVRRRKWVVMRAKRCG